jgi:O-antigen ligase
MKIRSSRLPVILFGGWFLVMAFLFFNPYLGGLFERMRNTFVDTNTSFRVLEYKTSFNVIKDNYLIGVGSGQQLHYFKDLLEYSTGQAQLVNNYFLQALIDLGIAGLFIFCLLFWQIYKLTRNNKLELKYLHIGFTAALICALINGLAEVTIFALPYAICFWFLLGALKNLSFYEKSRSDNY